MDNKLFYQDIEYQIIESINMDNNTFVICVDENNKVRYFKRNKIHDYFVYTPLDRMIRVLPDYQNEETENIKNIIDELSKTVEKKVKHNKLNKIKSKLQGFSEYAKRKKYKLNKKDIAWYMGGIGRLRKFASIYVVIMLVSMIGFGTCGTLLFNWFNEGKQVNTVMADVLEDIEITEEYVFEAPNKAAAFTGDGYINQKYGADYWNYAETTMMNVDFSELLNINPDTKGWIYVNDTNINYPFVQSGDNSYYLNHSFNGSYNVAGWLFADYRTDFDNLKKNSVIYGHGRIDQVMFGSLNKVLEESWYTNEENQVIKISTPNKNMLWQIVSIYTIQSESYYLTHTFENNTSFQKYIDTMLSRSIYNFNQEVTPKDKLLTLSTCLDNNGNRIVVQAKLLYEENR